MITEFDLDAAIAECQGVKNPNAKTCMMLAAYLIIKKELFGDEKTDTSAPLYSYDAPEPSAETITYNSDTEFSTLIHGRYPDDIWAIMDDLMSMLQALNPRLYKSVMRKIEEG